MNLELKITKKEIIVFVALSFFAGMVFLGFKTLFNFQLQYENDLLLSEEKYSSHLIKKDPFRDLSLSAKAFFVWDIQKNKSIGGVNEEMQFPLASLTKLMTILVASQLSTEDTKIVIDYADLDADGESGLRVGEQWNFIDLIDFVLLTSSNDGAQAVASVVNAFDDIPNGKTEREVFLEAMNQQAKDLGMSQSFFLNETGLDLNQKVSGAYGSAKDVSILVDKIMRDYPEILNVSSLERAEVSSDMMTHLVDNTNQTVGNLPNIVASKTGFTDLAGGNLAVVFDAGIGHKVVVVVLGSTKEERFSDVEKLVWATLEDIFNNSQKI